MRFHIIQGRRESVDGVQVRRDWPGEVCTETQRDVLSVFVFIGNFS